MSLKNADTYVSTAEAAFIAGLSDRDMNRVIDEHLVPESLVNLSRGRSFTRLAAAFARFYFGAEQELVASLRKKILCDLTRRVELSESSDLVFGLGAKARSIDWRINTSYAEINVSRSIEESIQRTQQITLARSLISADAQVMGGLPVFAGTRVPIEIILASLDKGIDGQRLTDSYPFLTEELVSAAMTYNEIHPRRGRQRHVPEAEGWKIKTSSIVRPVQACKRVGTTVVDTVTEMR